MYFIAHIKTIEDCTNPVKAVLKKKKSTLINVKTIKKLNFFTFLCKPFFLRVISNMSSNSKTKASEGLPVSIKIKGKILHQNHQIELLQCDKDVNQVITKS